jgi:hypothetical protein
MVFRHLSRTEQFEYLLICKSWSRAAAAIYYRKVYFSPEVLSYLRENHLLECDTANNGPARTLPNGGLFPSHFKNDE